MKDRLDHDLEEGIRRALDGRAAGLDGATLSRLRQAREQALARGSRERWRLLPAARWAGALAGMALLAAAWVVWRQVADQGPPATAGDLEVLASTEDLDLYRELDFYLWLEREGKEALAGEAEDRT